MKKPQIKPHFRLEIIEPKHVYLLSEYATHALTGVLYCQILPLLNGQHTREDLIHKLNEQVPPEHLDYVLDRLQQKGYLTDAAHELTSEVAAFWSGLGVEPLMVAEHLPQVQVSVIAVGVVDPQPLISALAAIGISAQVGEMGGVDSLRVVLTDDYLQPELSRINQTALQTQQSWLQVKPIGSVVWLGPIFHPGTTGCWECLTQRLWGNREVETSVLRQKGETGKQGERGCLPVAFAGLPSTVQAVIGLTTTEIAKWLVKQSVPGSPLQTLEGKITTLDQATLTLKTHLLPHRPQCPACGDPGFISRQLNQPIALTSRKKLFTQDGGHRAFTPDQILKRYEHLISPITGVVSSLTRSPIPITRLYIPIVLSMPLVRLLA